MPYKNFSLKELILRDHLAIDRTVLANERTFLAYVRTFVALLAVGATLIHFSQAQLAQSLGVIFIVASIMVLLMGAKRYFWMKKQIASSRSKW